MTSPAVSYAATRKLIARQTHVAPGGSGTGPAHPASDAPVLSARELWVRRRQTDTPAPETVALTTKHLRTGGAQNPPSANAKQLYAQSLAAKFG